MSTICNTWVRSLHGTAGRRGKKKAIVAVGRSILLAGPEVRYADLGCGFYDTWISRSQDAQPRGQLKPSATPSSSNPAA